MSIQGMAARNGMGNDLIEQLYKEIDKLPSKQTPEQRGYEQGLRRAIELVEIERELE